MDPFLVHRGKLSNLATHHTPTSSHTRLVKEVQLRKGKKGEGRGSKLPASCFLTTLVSSQNSFNSLPPILSGFICRRVRARGLLPSRTLARGK